MRLSTALRRWPRRTLTSLGVGVAVVVLTATQASAVSPGHYTIGHSSGASFQFLTSGNLVPPNTTADDDLYYLSTTGSGIHRLPFALHLYNQTYQNAAISTNGNVQPGVPSGGGTSAFSNNCLPTTTFGRPAVLPFWDDLFFDSGDTSHGFMEGVFVKTSGSAPHRKFVVSWQGHHFNDASGTVLAQAIFQEGSQTVNYVYLIGNASNAFSAGSSATIGIQSKQQLSSTQWSCGTDSSPHPNAISSGLKLTLTHSG
jgi:hypothetical protein